MKYVVDTNIFRIHDGQRQEQQWHDAIIAEVALVNGYGLVTCDRDLEKARRAASNRSPILEGFAKEQGGIPMTTTSYFEADLPVAAGNGKADESAPKTTAEILVSSYSGEHMLYLKIIDADVDEKLLVLRKQHAVDLLAGLERAAFYLRYIE